MTCNNDVSRLLNKEFAFSKDNEAWENHRNGVTEWDCAKVFWDHASDRVRTRNAEDCEKNVPYTKLRQEDDTALAPNKSKTSVETLRTVKAKLEYEGAQRKMEQELGLRQAPKATTTVAYTHCADAKWLKWHDIPKHRGNGGEGHEEQLNIQTFLSNMRWKPAQQQ